MKKQPKTRHFRLLKTLLSKNADRPSYANSYGLPSSYSFYNENNELKIYALSPTMKTLDTDDDNWARYDINDPQNRPRLEKPSFNKGSIICGTDGYNQRKAEFLYNSPWCANGPNADPTRATFEEVIQIDNAKERNDKRKLQFKCMQRISELDQQELAAHCTIMGIVTRDSDGAILEKDALEDNVMRGLDELAARDGNKVYTSFLNQFDTEMSDIKIALAMALNKGEIVHDKFNMSVGLKGGTSVLQIKDNNAVIDEMAFWIASGEGKGFYARVVDSLGIIKAVTVDPNEFTEEGKRLWDLPTGELFKEAYGRDIITHKRGLGYEMNGEFINNHNQSRIKSQADLIDFMRENQNFRLMVTKATADEIEKRRGGDTD